MQCVEQLRIARQRNSTVNILLCCLRDQCPRANILDKGCTKAAAEALPPHRHHRHTHVERIAGRPATRIGEGIERNIHAIVGCEIIPRRSLRIDACERNTCRLNALQNLRTCVCIGKDIRLEEQAAPLHAAQDLRPDAQHLIIQLCEVVEAAENDAASRRRCVIDCRCRVQRLPAEMCLRKDEQFLHEAFFCLPRRKNRIRKEVIHRRETC